VFKVERPSIMVIKDALMLKTLNTPGMEKEIKQFPVA